MSELDDVRRTMHRELNAPGKRPDATTRITRRTFLRRSIVGGTAVGAAAYGWFPLINTIDVASAAVSEPFRFAWISDTHLYPADVNTRFVDKTKRAIEEVQAMNPPVDFMIFGGDLAQRGDPVELELGKQLLKELKVEQLFIPGEHDWYLDLGKKWEKDFGKSPWKKDHKGVRLIGLNTVGQAPDYWSVKKMSPKERMAHMEVLDGTVAGPWSGLGPKQLQWLQKAVSDWPKGDPMILFTHNPLYEYYPPWNFWVRDWREVHEILDGYTNVTNIHGHVHQVLYNEIGSMRSIGMLATSWPWPYAPEGVPALTKPMLRVDPGDHFDGVGWSLIGMDTNGKAANTYKMWRKAEHIFAEATADSGTGDNDNQILSRRIADKMWPYK
ncbi:MAG: metallophosphoesterase [Gammaproteobacteria bacterium]|nr:metallophosphoesterase [Gammaproteobacteria bacterium]MDD9823664.1 metallophosphoesterase [Gammaproteobacteria bacterium]MDD9864063.1 metallophosphoesterase [Gammaproteobacteria bacterium]